MRHNIATQGEAFALRPVEVGDSEFIFWLRSDPRLSRFINRSAVDVQAQRSWIEAYYQRPQEYYFIIENLFNGRPEGTVSIYDINTSLRIGEWGRWVLKGGSVGAVESVLLICRVAFEQLGLKAIYSRTVADNVSVVSFHDSSGAERSARLQSHFNINGVFLDAIEHKITRDGWEEVTARLGPLAARTARVIARSSVQ